MKVRLFARRAMTLFFVAALTMTFIISAVSANSDFVDGSENYLSTENAGKDVSLGPTNVGTATSGTTVGNEGSRNSTNEWSEFIGVDRGSAQLVIGINNGILDAYTRLMYIIAKHDCEVVNTVSIKGEIIAVVVNVSLTEMSSFVEETRADGLSTYIEPRMKVQAQFVPNDPFWSLQWGPQKIEADWAWNTTIGDPSVLVAVIDTGIDWDHPDLAANYVALGYDWVNNDTDPMDDEGHGTHCAGIIAAVINNSIGVAGLAQVRIMAEKGLDQYGEGYEDDLANAIIHAVDQGADILSNSWGGYGEMELIHDAVKYAYDAGVLVVAAAGNDATSTKLYPAAYDEVIAVTATDQYDNPAYFTNFGEWVDLAAPGVDIYSTYWNDTYRSMSGTSMSTPHVAGVASLILSRFPNITRDQVRLQLQSTADDLGDPGFDDYYGYGRINARRAVEQALPDHDLLILKWERPRSIEPGALATVNTTVFNFGTHNESNIIVQLLINGSIVDSATIDFLETATSETAICTWTSTIEGTYNLTSYVLPVPGETLTTNNVVTAMIRVGYAIMIGIIETHGESLHTEELANYYTDLGHIVEKITTTITPGVLDNYDIIIVGEDWGDTPWLPSEIAAVKAFIDSGKGFVAIGDELATSVQEILGTYGISYTGISAPGGSSSYFDPLHPIMQGVSLIYAGAPVNSLQITAPAYWIANDISDTYILIAGAEVGGYALCLSNDFAYYLYNDDNEVMFKNIVDWMTVKYEHELAVRLDAPNFLEPGDSSLLNATVYNSGLNNETDVELFLLINGTIANNVTIPELVNGTSHTLSYLWTPTVEGIYNLTAYAPPVPGENITANNWRSEFLGVFEVVKAVVLDSWGTDHGYDAFWDYLNANWATYGSIPIMTDYTSLNKENITLADIETTHADVLIISDAWSDTYAYGWEFSDSEIEAIKTYVLSGHGIIATSGTFDTWTAPNNQKLAELFGMDLTVWYNWGFNGDEKVTSGTFELQTPRHNELWRNIPDPYLSGSLVTLNPTPSFDWAIQGVITGWIEALSTDHYAAVITSDRSTYKAVYFTCMLEYMGQYNENNRQLFYNAIVWTQLPPYEHELIVSLEAPKFLEPGDSSLLNATVYNSGLNNETDVELQLLINGTEVDSVVVPELPSGSSYTLSYLWTPIIEGIYNVTAYAPPVPDENVTANNMMSVFVNVEYLEVALFKNVDPWDYPANEEALSLYGIAYAVFSSSDFGLVDLSSFSKVVIASDQDQAFYNAMDAYRWWFEDYVSSGGVLEIHAADWGWHGGQWVGNLPGGLGWVHSASDHVTIVDHTHPVVTIPNPITDAELDGWSASVHGYFSTYPAYSRIVIIEDSTGFPAYLEFRYGAGFILASSQTLEWAYKRRYSRILENSLLYTPVKYEHDLAVTLEAPAFLELGTSVLLNATVYNSGLSNETGVELQLLINSTLVDSVVLPELLTGASYTLSYLWTPTRTGNYNITAYAPPVTGEDYTANNVVTKEVVVFFYTRSYLPHEWVGGGVPMGWHADDSSWQYDLPFDFPFYGIHYRTIYISSNGLITFIGPDANYSNSIPALAQKLAIAPAWDDWVTYDPYDIYTWQNSTHIGIRWYVRAYGSSVVANFEAILRADGVIRFNYGYNDGPISATIGISNGAGHILAEDVTSLNYINTILFTPFPRYTLTVYSVPSGIPFTVDSVSHTTPWSETYDEDTSVNLEMPEIHTVGDARYYWDQWSDGNTSRSRTVIMITNITLTAYFTGPYYQLTVTSSPITGITFTINGVLKTTPYTEWLHEGSYTIIMPQTHDGYVWSHWLEDGDTSRIKTITLQGTAWTAIYVPAPPPPPPVGGKATPINIPVNKPELPALWVWLTILLPLAATAVFVKLKKKKQ